MPNSGLDIHGGYEVDAGVVVMFQIGSEKVVVNSDSTWRIISDLLVMLRDNDTPDRRALADGLLQTIRTRN